MEPKPRLAHSQNPIEQQPHISGCSKHLRRQLLYIALLFATINAINASLSSIKEGETIITITNYLINLAVYTEAWIKVCWNCILKHYIMPRWQYQSKHLSSQLAKALNSYLYICGWFFIHFRFAKHRGLVNCGQFRLYICWYPVYTNAVKFYTFNPYSTAANNIGKKYNGPEYRYQKYWSD